jgi:hypothetical protein
LQTDNSIHPGQRHTPFSCHLVFEPGSSTCTNNWIDPCNTDNCWSLILCLWLSIRIWLISIQLDQIQCFFPLVCFRTSYDSTAQCTNTDPPRTSAQWELKHEIKIYFPDWMNERQQKKMQHLRSISHDITAMQKHDWFFPHRFWWWARSQHGCNTRIINWTDNLIKCHFTCSIWWARFRLITVTRSQELK